VQWVQNGETMKVSAFVASRESALYKCA